MNEYLKLGNELILKDSKARENHDTLFVYIEDKTIDFKKAYKLLSNQKNVEKITYHYYKADLIFEGFTKITSLQDDGYRIIAVLKKEVDDNGEN